MKFSIVISTYNRLSLLKRAVESALQQTVSCEVVVADDHSSDGTQEYLESLGSRITYHRNPINQGHCAAVNHGVEAASGDWIKLLDDDDYLAPNCIEQMQKAIAQRPQAVICSCLAIQVNEQEEEISRTQPSGQGQAFYIPQEDIHYGMLLEVVPFGTPVQVAFRRDAFFKTGGWDSTLDGNCDDIDSWVKIAQHGDAIFLNEHLAYRTLWPGGINQKFSLQKRLETNIQIKEKIYDRIHPVYQTYLPNFNHVQNYLKLHWAMVGMKQKQPLLASKLASSALLSPPAWKMLADVMYARKVHHKSPSIRQIQLAIMPSQRLAKEMVSS